MNSSNGFACLLTGPPAVGKTTIAVGVQNELRGAGYRDVQVLDGDIARPVFCSHLGFSRQDRDLNVRRFGRVAKALVEDNAIVLISIVAPYQEARDNIRTEFERASLRFFEVAVYAPFSTRQERDPKGLYRREQQGLVIGGLTGVSSPYEHPVDPDLRIETHRENAADSIARVINLIMSVKQ